MKIIFYLYPLISFITTNTFAQEIKEDPFLGYNVPINLGIMKFENESNEIGLSENLYTALIDNQLTKVKFTIYKFAALETIIPGIGREKGNKLINSLRGAEIEFIITGTIIDSLQILFELIRTADGERLYEQTISGNNKEDMIDKIIQLITTGSYSESLNHDMILVEGSFFRMGYLQPVDSSSIDLDEVPAHEVQINSFYIDKYEVTVSEYKKFCEELNREMPAQPEWGEENHPIVNVSWEDAKAYAEWAGKRLPSESEWEFAARGGSKTQGFDYSGGNEFNKYAWFAPNSNNKSQQVGTKEGNELGIYDMSGNVWEWCENDYAPYGQEITSGKDFRPSKIIRGGSFSDPLKCLRVCNRSRYYPLSKADNIGFRCAKDVDK